MLYSLLHHLITDWLGKPADVPYFYKSALFRSTMAMPTAAGIVFVCAPSMIRWLIKKKVGDRPDFDNQTLNQITAGKKNTPTMGGIILIFAIGAATLLWMDLSSFFVRLSLLVMLWLGALGAVDDWLKLTRKKDDESRDGLKSWEKLLFQIGLSVLVAAFILRNSEGEGASLSGDWTTGLNLIFYKHPIHVGDWLMSLFSSPPGATAPASQPFLWTVADAVARFLTASVFVIVTVLVITGSSNAVNLTDGMDGLASGCMGIVSFVFMIICYLVGSGAGPNPTDGTNWAIYLGIPSITGAGELAILCGAMLGACLGFLWFNCNPAQVFMGDTGSLTLGGLIGYVAVITRFELLLFIVGGVFVWEAVSVMSQVSYFKYTKKKFGEGRRLFLMSPIHHHFHLKGWTETQVVVRFWLVGIFCAALALATLKLR
jgi:phospho-N-acetylmuramoyl-pentapeptide-transferase